MRPATSWQDYELIDATGGSRWQAELLFELAVPGTFGAAALWPLFDRLAADASFFVFDPGTADDGAATNAAEWI